MTCIISILEYANKLADEGRFPQALQEIVDLFVSKYQASKSTSSVDQNNEEDDQWYVFIVIQRENPSMHKF